MRFKLKPWLAAAISLLTIVAFVYYFATHPEVGHQLQQTSFKLLIWLLFLYLLTVLALAMVTVTSLRICKLRLPRGESFLLTAYTAVVNFFGPLQSGPAFRGVYLNKKYGLKVKDFTLVTLLYLAFWGVISGLALFSGVLGWWLLPLGLIAVGLIAWESRSRRFTSRWQHIDLRVVSYLGLATLLQASLTAAIYYSELRSVAPGTHLNQAIIYTGAANLALFVSLTPAAIGFRESFLLFSRHLHHISGSTIVAASILDRSVYIVFLALLATYIFGTHANSRLQAVRKTT